MSNCQEQNKRQERAGRLKKARALAGFRGPKGVATALNMSVNNCKAQEQGRMGIGVTDARRYARLFGVSFEWLYFGAEPLKTFSTPRMMTGWKERLNAAVSESGRSISDNSQNAVFDCDEEPSIELIVAMADELGVSLSYIMFGYEISGNAQQQLDSYAKLTEEQQKALLGIGQVDGCGPEPALLAMDPLASRR